MQISRHDLRSLILEEMNRHPALVLDESALLLPGLLASWMGIDFTDGVSKDEFLDVMDVWLTTIAATADLIPVLGTAASTAINAASMSYAISRENWLGAGLGIVSIIVPGFGDSLSALGKVLKANAKAFPPGIILQVAKGLARAGDLEIKQWITSNLSDADKASDTGDKIVKAVKEFAKGLQASVEKLALEDDDPVIKSKRTA